MQDAYESLFGVLYQRMNLRFLAIYERRWIVGKEGTEEESKHGDGGLINKTNRCTESNGNVMEKCFAYTVHPSELIEKEARGERYSAVPVQRILT